MAGERDRFGCFLAACSPSKMLSESNQPVLRLKQLRFPFLELWPGHSDPLAAPAATAKRTLPGLALVRLGLCWFASVLQALAKPLNVLSRSRLRRHPYHKVRLVRTIPRRRSEAVRRDIDIASKDPRACLILQHSQAQVLFLHLRCTRNPAASRFAAIAAANPRLLHPVAP